MAGISLVGEALGFASRGSGVRVPSVSTKLEHSLKCSLVIAERGL